MALNQTDRRHIQTMRAAGVDVLLNCCAPGPERQQRQDFLSST